MNPSSDAEPFFNPPFSLLYPSPTSSDDDPPTQTQTLIPQIPTRPGFINPTPHISTQFYTFTPESHSLMLKCLLESRPATPSEIRSSTPPSLLLSWRSVWKDRNEDTAYLTAWKRIQDKLQPHPPHFISFKNTPSHQFVSHYNQWQDIVTSFHSNNNDSTHHHLSLKDTIDKIKQAWTVGAKFYGIPESFIRACVSSCSVCSDSRTASTSKRRRFEYTETMEVAPREVPNKLQMLARKYKVVLCIRQKYVRHKPFMAEVKDYACHRAGEPASKKTVKREPYASKRCGCGFRIRAIVPIANYNEKDKSFVYEEEGVAVFKMYAVHTGHEPGPLDGNARIMHRVVGQKGGFLMDQEEYGVNEGDDFRVAVMQQLQELKNEVAVLEGKVGKMPEEMLGSVSRELCDIVNKVRLLGEEASKNVGSLSLANKDVLSHWSDAHTEGMYVDGKDTDLIDDDDDSFERTLHEVAPWDQMDGGCRSEKDIISEACKAEKWLNSSEFDEKGILHSQGSKVSKAGRHDESIDTDVGLVGIQVDSFYPENPKWYDSPCGLDSGADCGDSGFRHGEIV